MTAQDRDERPGASRRSVLGATLGAAAVAVVGAGGYVAGRSLDDSPGSAPTPTGRVPFYAMDHQAGIATPAQDRLAFAAFDIATADRGSVMAMLGAV